MEINQIMNETPRNLLHVPHFSGSIKLDVGEYTARSAWQAFRVSNPHFP